MLLSSLAHQNLQGPRALEVSACQLAGLPISTNIPDNISQRQHVIEDLCPYTCIAENCPTPQLLFCTRSEWESHVKKSHLPHWQCPFCEEQVEDYATMDSMGSHIQSKHELELLETPLSTILSWSAVQKMGITHCPLCSSQGPEDSPELIDHILWHAYDFALRALPWPVPVSHDLNIPPGEFNFPEDTARATNLQSWIDGKMIYESPEELELELSQYDRADHCPSVPADVSEYSDYFRTNPYFDDSPDDRSSKPQGNQSKPSHRSIAYLEDPIEEREFERPLHNSKTAIKDSDFEGSNRETAEDHSMSEKEPSNASGYVIQHHDNIGESDDPEHQLAAIFANQTLAEQTYLQETDIERIGVILRHSKFSWCHIPRIYSILRIIGHLEYVNLFIQQDITDYWLPLSGGTFPEGLDSGCRTDFIEAQQLVFNTQLIGTSSAAVYHCHFRKEDQVPLRSMNTLSSGVKTIVDGVQSTITQKHLVRKRIHRGRSFKNCKRAQQSFEAELAICKKISKKHTHLPIFYNSYTDPQYTAILMSPIADCTLEEFLRQDLGNLQTEILWTLFGCLASVLHFLHSSFISHRDIKPNHVLLKGEDIVLVGFGYALDWSDLEDDRESGALAAFTRRYAAPEVISDDERSPLTDVWSLGCVFLEIWTVLNGESLEGMNSYLEKGTDNTSCYADNLERVSLWITHLQELPDNKVDKAPAEWIRNMLTPDQRARWSAQTLFDAINQHGGRFIGECCRVRGNKQQTSETHDMAESDAVSRKWVWTDPDQGTEDKMVEGKSSNAASGATPKHPYIDIVAQRPTTALSQGTAASTTSNEQSKIKDLLRKNLTSDSGSGQSRIRRWFDKAGAYISGTGQEEPDTQQHKNKNAHEFPEVPGEESRVHNLPRTREQLTNPNLEELVRWVAKPPSST